MKAGAFFWGILLGVAVWAVIIGILLAISGCRSGPVPRASTIAEVTADTSIMTVETGQTNFGLSPGTVEAIKATLPIGMRFAGGLLLAWAGSLICAFFIPSPVRRGLGWVYGVGFGLLLLAAGVALWFL